MSTSTRTTVTKVDSAAPAAGTVVIPVGAPEWAKKATLIVTATTAGASTVDAKVVQSTETDTSTHRVDVPSAAIDQIPASQTAVSRFLTWGDVQAAVAGTSIDVVAFPLSGHQRISYTLVGTVTALKIEIEFQG